MGKMYMHTYMCIEITSNCTAVNQAVGYVTCTCLYMYISCTCVHKVHVITVLFITLPPVYCASECDIHVHVHTSCPCM